MGKVNEGMCVRSLYSFKIVLLYSKPSGQHSAPPCSNFTTVLAIPLAKMKRMERENEEWRERERRTKGSLLSVTLRSLETVMRVVCDFTRDNPTTQHVSPIHPSSFLTILRSLVCRPSSLTYIYNFPRCNFPCRYFLIILWCAIDVIVMWCDADKRLRFFGRAMS